MMAAILTEPRFGMSRTSMVLRAKTIGSAWLTIPFGFIAKPINLKTILKLDRLTSPTSAIAQRPEFNQLTDGDGNIRRVLVNSLDRAVQGLLRNASGACTDLSLFDWTDDFIFPRAVRSV
jgi:hypothetical protein